MITPARNPQRSSHLLQMLAYIYLRNNRPEKAMTLLQAIDIIDSGERQHLALLALAQQRSGQFEQALQTLARISKDVADESLDASVALIRTQALQALGRTQDAVLSMQTYVQHRARQHAANNRSVP